MDHDRITPLVGSGIVLVSLQMLEGFAMASRDGSELELLLRLIDEGFDRRSWHGPNLRGSIRGLSARQALSRPRADRRSIAEHVMHAAYWKYTVRRRLRGDKRGSFPLKGSNWFPVPDDWTEQSWRDAIRLLETEHRALRAAIAELTAGELHQRLPGSELTRRALITGIAYHDVYHAGQINLIKRLARTQRGGS